MPRQPRKTLILVSALTLVACGASGASGASGRSASAPDSRSVSTTATCGSACDVLPPVLTLSSGTGPAKKYDCSYNVATSAYTGAFGTASAIGWESNSQGVVTCLGGTFFVQAGIYKDFGFGIYNGSPTTWTDADGYLPAQVTAFQSSGADVSITEFADEVTLDSHSYVAVYSRVAVHNGTDHVVNANPEPSKGMVLLHTAPNSVKPGASAYHDYVVATDRFGHNYPWPTPTQLELAGSFDEHYTHMRTFWNKQLAGIAEVSVPDSSLSDAYKSGFIYTQIARSGDHLNTGVNGYESEFSHDVVGILGNMFTQGYFSDAHALLLDARNVVGGQGQYDDGIWTYSWPWATYLMKTGDISFVRQNFSTEGPKGATQPSIEDTVLDIAKSRTGPGGIMEATNDIDTDGYWTVDDYEALMGLVAYGYIAGRLGDTAQVKWATGQYDSLLSATNATLDATTHRYGLDYLPCSMLEPNTSNRCDNPEDANWAAPFQFGKWAWDGQLFGALLSGPGLSLIDSTYSYGFNRLKKLLPPDTFGGYPTDYYSTGYNAGHGSWGLSSNRHRDQGILSYEFMIQNDQSGPYSWWESSSAPAPSPWIGTHPGTGQGASPHAWGISEANKVLLDSLAAQRSDGELIVGRGVPPNWLASGDRLSVSDFPTTNGHRVNLEITSSGTSVTLRVSGGNASGDILFELPSFVHNVAASSKGSVDQATGTVAVPWNTTEVTVQFLKPPA
jgi:hypothetical protein